MLSVFVAGLLFAAAAQLAPASAQQVTGTPGAPGTLEFPNSRVLPIPTPPFAGAIQPNFVNSTPAWPPTIAPPDGAPNVLLILIDDAGFGSNSTFGGVVPTPTLDKLAQQGLRYTQIHNTALCSPTRAALLTGRNHHVSGFGMVAEGATGYPGYNSVTPPETAHVAATLRENGYATAWFGKNHNVPIWEATPAGPFTNWPIGLGYDYFYGFVGGDTSQWQPGNLFRNMTPIHPYNGSPGWNLVTAMADDAIAYINTQTATNPKRPWFIHYAPGATHAPHHPTKEWVDKISAMKLFDEGWEKVRERIFNNQKRLGVIPANAKLPDWPDFLAKWETLSADQKRLYLRQIDVWAAYMAYSDHEIGRVIDTIEKLGQLDNTLIIFICGDNGMSAEGSLNGTPNEVAYFNGVAFTVDQMLPLIPVWGTDQTYNHFAVPWAFAMDTPYRWTKQVASHLGGTRTGMVVTWPKRITDRGGIRNQFHHVIDIAPTILEAIGIPQPTMVNGIAQRPYDGVSMVYTWAKENANAPSTRKTQYFEIFGNRAIYHDGWMANTTPAVTPWEGVNANPPVDVMNGFKWELYNLVEDPTQTNDLAAKEPERLRMMQELWMIEAVRNHVLPLNDSQLPILTTERPGPAAGRTQIRLHGADDLHSIRRGAVDSQPLLPYHGGDRGAARRGERGTGDAGRPVLGLWPLPKRRQTHVHDEPARHREAEVARRRGIVTREAHHRFRLDDGPAGAGPRALRHGHAFGRWQASCAAVVAKNPAAYLGMGRDIRYRPRHRHAGGRRGLSGAVRLHRQDAEDHLRPRPIERVTAVNPRDG